MLSDSTGHAPEWLRDFLDIFFSAAAVGAAAYGGTFLGLGPAIVTFSAINNLTNAIYYNFFSTEESNLTPESYRDGYINRWDSLDSTKKMTEDQTYNLNAWRYFSEYNFHMYAWYMFGWAHNKNIFLFSTIAKGAYEADVDSDSFETGKDWWRNIFYILVGSLGL